MDWILWIELSSSKIYVLKPLYPEPKSVPL